MASSLLLKCTTSASPVTSFCHPVRVATRRGLEPERGHESTSLKRISYICGWQHDHLNAIHISLAEVRERHRLSGAVRATYSTVSRESGGRGGPLWYVPSHETVGDCLVTFPPHKASSLKGIINFVGGAFVGAAPQVTYSLFIDLLASAGYVVVATPYPLTFDHSAMARVVHVRFQSCLSLLDERSQGDTWPWDTPPSNLPIYAVGHSNGALLMLLAGCLCKDGKTASGNVLVSFNNKPASEAIPFFDQVGPALVRAAPLMDSLPFAGFARRLADEAARLASTSPFAPPLPPGLTGDDVAPFLPIVDQIGPIFEQIASGTSEFTPTPSRNCAIVAESYAIPHTLLVKFSVDALDETDDLYELLQPVVEREGGSLRLTELQGMHLSPAAQDVRWRVGQVYTPIDAIAQVVKANALADIKKAVAAIVDWFDELPLAGR